MESIKELRKICQELPTPEHPLGRFWRIFSIYFTKIFLILGIKPNSITLFSFLIGIMGGFFYFKNQFLLGSLFFFFFAILDCVDGEVARYRKSSSQFGAWLEVTTINILYPYFFLTLGLGIFFQTREFRYFLLATIAATAKLIERSLSKSPSQLKKPLLKSVPLDSVKEWLGYFAKMETLVPAILFCSFLNWEKEFLWFFGIYLSIFVLAKIILTGWRVYRYNLISG